MSETRKEMIATLRRVVIPVLAEKGFAGRFPHFRRIRKRRIDLLTFQFWRDGGSFVVEVASCPTAGTMWWGDPVEPELVTAHDVNDRLRLSPNPTRPDSCWIKYDNAVKKKANPEYEKAAKKVIGCLPQAESYWKKKK